MKAMQVEAALKDRKMKFVNFRWVLMIWLGAVTALRVDTRTELGTSIYLLLAVFCMSQMALRSLPLRFFEGLKVLNAIFLMDLNFILAGLWLTHQVQPELLVALFLGTFMAALSRNMAQSIVTTTVVLALYLGFEMGTLRGFHFDDPQQLLQLPLLFISGAHSTMLAQEATNELSARQVLQEDKTRLSRHMNSSFSEIAHYCKDMSALVDALPFGAIMLDSEAKIRVCNDIAEEILDIGAGTLLAGTLDSHPRLRLLKPFLEKAANEPLSDFHSVEFPGERGASWSLDLGVYPVREGEENRGVLMVLIPSGYGEGLEKAMPTPLILPEEMAPVVRNMTPSSLPLPSLPGLASLSLKLREMETSLAA